MEPLVSVRRIVVLLAALVACRRSTPSNEADAAASREHVVWRGEEVGLELFANGDFELAILPKGADQPKFLVGGTAGLKGTSIELQVARIWRGRWVNDAQKVSKTGELVEVADTLGHRFERGKGASLRLRTLDGGTAELCAETCTRVERRTPSLAGEWRRRGEPEQGALRRIDLDRHNVRLDWKRERADEAWSGVEAVSTGPDKFRLTLPAEHDAGPHTFEMHRLPNETLELCDGPTCNVFERYFNAYRYDVGFP